MVSNIDEAKAFYTGFLGLDAQDMGLDWVTRVVVPASGEHIQLLSADTRRVVALKRRNPT